MSFQVNVTPGSFKESQILREAAKLKLEVTQLDETVNKEYRGLGDGYKAIVDVLIDMKKNHTKIDKETFDRLFQSKVGTMITSKSDMGGLFPGGGDEIYERLVKKLL